MIQLAIQPIDIKRAQLLSRNLGALRGSFTDGRGQEAGFLGEMLLARYLGVNMSGKNFSYCHDLIYSGKTIEVKTKRRTQDPINTWEVSVAQSSSHQRADAYAFMSLTYEDYKFINGKRHYLRPKKMWLCGFYDVEQYFKDAKYIKQGSLDISNNFRAKVNMWNLPISRLQSSL